jgi:phosphatidylinositol alpha-mannosyltransferase
VALSETAAEAFRYSLGVKARVIHPGVDLRAFTPNGERAEQPTIFCAASVGATAKRVDLLVRAFARVRRERPAARLVLSRPPDPGLARQVADGQPGVEFADVDDRGALARAYREAWVSALPSLGEAFGLVLVESLACGTPVVGTDFGGIREVVDRDTIGRLFEGGEDALAGALLETLELTSDPATESACRARAEDFSTDRCTAEYVALYEELL